MFSAFLNDSVTILHNDGTRHENIPAMVERGKILLDDVSVPISVGERIERLLPSGQNETFSITDVQLTKGMGGIPDFYEIFVQREGARPSSRNQRSVNINVSGSPQAHVNLNSIDSSSNIVNIQASLDFVHLGGVGEDVCELSVNCGWGFSAVGFQPRQCNISVGQPQHEVRRFRYVSNFCTKSRRVRHFKKHGIS